MNLKDHWLATVVTDSNDAVLLFDLNGNLQAWNRGARGMYGWSEEEALRMNIRDIMPADRSDEMPDLIRRLLAGETVASFETQRRTKDGRVLDVWLTATAVRDEAKKVAAIATTERDITERKQAEQALREAQRNLSVIVDNISDGFYVLDRDWRFTYVNDGALRHFGKTREETLGRPILDLFPGLRGGIAEAGFRRAFETGQPVHFDVPSTLANRMMEAHAYPGADNMTVLFRDVTERKRLEEELRLLNAGLEGRVAEQTAEIRKKSAYNRSLIETSIDPLVTIGSNGKITDVNAATEQATGLGRGELIGSDFSDYFTEPDKARAGYEQVFREELVRDYPLEIRHRDGRTIPVLYNAAVYRDEAGNVAGVFAAARDITEVKQAEAAVWESEECLRLAQEAAHVGTFDWNIQTSVNVWTPELEAMYGLRPGEFARTQPAWEQMIHPEDRPETLRLVEQALRTGETTAGEWRVVWPDGSVHWVAGRWRLYKDAAGRPLRLSGVNLDITEMKQAQAALQQLNATLEQRVAERTADLQAVLDLTPVAVWIAHDPQCLRITGNRYADELIMRVSRGANISASARPGDAAVTFKVFRAGVELKPEELPAQVAAATGRPVAAEALDLVFSDGRVTHMFMGAMPLFTAGGRVRGSVAAGADITPIKLAEEAMAAELDATTRLQQIGARFVKAGQLEDVLGEIVEAAIAITHADMGNIQLRDASSGCLKIAAFRGFNQRFRDFWNAVAEGQGACGTAMKNAQRVIVEDVSQSPIFVGTPALEVQTDAGVRAVQSTPLMAHSGDLLGMLSTHWHVPHRPEPRELQLLDLLAQEAVDIIEFVRAEEALREGEARFRSTMDNMLEGCQILGHDWQYIYINDAAERHNKRPKGDLIGKRYMDMWPGIEATNLFAMIRRCMEERTAQALENEFTFPDGNVGWFDLSIQPVPEGVFILSVDITERKRAEEEIRRHVEELRAANEDLTRFNRAAVDRELRMIDLKKQVNELCKKAGQPVRYKVELEKKEESD